jgi:ABC-type Mn2+/Zn2+ transport system ATPase subunit
MSGPTGGGPVPAVRTRDLVLAHGDHVAVDRATMDIGEGSVVAVIGPNGSGKSSFLDAVAGLLAPRAGTIEVLGQGAGSADVAYVFQRTEAPVHLPLTVGELVTMGRYGRTGLLGRLGAGGRTAVRTSLERVGMAELVDRQLLELSGGQRQRVLVAQGLAAEARMLLLDEPMTGLDVVSREQVLAVVFEERDAGRTVLFSTHDLAEAARADLVVLLSGRLVAVGTPADALAEANLRDAYRGRLVDLSGLLVLDDPHHHGDPADRHDGHQH